MLTYSFSKIGSESLYMYLYKCIREDILTGKITPGTKLPSKRSFAENLGVSVITVENAYAQLVSEGYVYALPKKGFFAANLEKSTAPQKKESPRTQMPVPPKYFADFSSSRTDPQNFPFATWAKRSPSKTRPCSIFRPASGSRCFSPSSRGRYSP